MTDHIDLMRQALILCNVELTPADNSDNIYSIGDRKKPKPLNTVKARETLFSSRGVSPVKDWHIDLMRSTSDRNLLTEQERAWIKFAYAQDRSTDKSKVLRDAMKGAYDIEFVHRASTARNIENLLILAVYAVSIEVFSGKKIKSYRIIAQCIGVSVPSYKQYWRKRFDWAKSYVRALDESAISSLADYHSDMHFMQLGEIA